MTSDVLSGIMILAPVPEWHACRVGILRKPSRWGLGHLVLGLTAQGDQSDLTPAGVRSREQADDVKKRSRLG